MTTDREGLPALSEGELYAAHARASERCRCGHIQKLHLWNLLAARPGPCSAWGAFPEWCRCRCRAFDPLLPGEIAEEWGK